MTFEQRKTIKGRIRWAWYRFLWNIAPHVPLPFPVHVDIEITSACNLACSHCHQVAEPRVYDLKTLRKAEIFRRLKEARTAGVLSFKPLWRGESLIHADIWEILNYALELDFVDIIINTNLSVEMTEDQIKLLAKIPTLKVSIDSITNYAGVRVGGNLDLVMSNMARLFRYRDSLKTNRHEFGLTEPFSEYIAAFREHFTRAYKSNQIGPDDGLSAFSAIQMFNGTARKRNQEKHYYAVGEAAGMERVYCGMPSRRLMLSSSGNILPCCAAYDEPENMVVGLRTSSIMDTWQSKKIRQFRRQLKANIMPTTSCVHCASSDAWR